MRVAIVSAALFLVVHSSVEAQSATEKASTAIRAREAIRLQVIGKKLHISVDRENVFPELKKDQSFVTRGPVAITFYRINPLRHQVTTQVATADDPTHGTIAKLVEGLLSAAAIIRPADAELQKLAAAARRAERTAEPVSRTCKPLDDALQLVGRLNATLYDPAWSGATLRNEVKAWSDTIDTAHSTSDTSGPAAINAGIAKIKAYLTPPSQMPLADVVKQAESNVRALDDALKGSVGASTECDRQARAVYEGLRIADPERRVAEIRKIYGSVTALAQTLTETYANGRNWRGDVEGEFKHDFILVRSVEPTSATMQVVTAKVVALDYGKLDDFVPELTPRREDLVSGSFTVRQYARFVPEIGVGAVFAHIERTRFGTGTSVDGRTIVTESEPQNVSVDPAVIVNFVSRAGWTPSVTPMFQIGVSTAKETPALFFGGGIRFFHSSKGDFAVGGGWVLPWVKKLKSLSVNDPVAGTTQIEEDLRFEPQYRATNVYLVLQYKF